MDKQYIIDEKLANSIMNYLATKPYIEVFEYIDALHNMQEAGGDKATKETPKVENK